MTTSHGYHASAAAPRRPGTRRLPAEALAAALAVAVTVFPSAAQASPGAKPAHPAAPAYANAATVAANKVLVLSFADALFNHADLSVIDTDTDGYIQHNPTVADGPEGLRSLVVFLHGLFPASHTTVERVIAQGDLVALQDRVVSVPGTAGQQIIDIYRVEHNKIVEHWDNLQPIPASTVSGHDLFSTLSGPPVSTPDPQAPTHANQRLVTGYFRAVTTGGTCAIRRLAGDLIQHDPAIGDGAAATAAYYAQQRAQNPAGTSTVARIVAEGDLVLVHSHYQADPTDLGKSVVDIYRVQRGRIVEHWDGIQAVPAAAANSNTMF